MGKFINTKVYKPSEDLFSEDSSLKGSLMEVFNEPSDDKNDVFGFPKDIIKIFSKFNCGQLIKGNKFNRSVDVEVDLKEFIKLSDKGSKVIYTVNKANEDDSRIFEFYTMCDGLCFSSKYINDNIKAGINQEEVNKIMEIN